MRRLVPIVEWLPRYDRRWLRGDVAAGIAVTALIVPKNLGYAGIAGVPLQNGLYAAAAGALIYALFCTSRQISTGPSSSLAAVAGGAVLVTGLGGEQAAQLVAAITLLTGVLFLLLAVVQDGLDRPVPLQGGRDGLPGGCRRRRRHRRAAEADRDVLRGRQRLAGAGVVAAHARGHPLDDAARRGRRARRDPRAAVRGAGDSGRAGARRRWAARVVRSSISVPTAWRSSATSRAGFPHPTSRLRPGPAEPVGDRDRLGRVAADRVLADRRRRTGVRDATPVPHRRRPGVGGAGDGERRRRGVPGHAGVDEPLGKLAQRVGRCAHTGGLARHGGARARDAGRARTAVLAAAESGARGDHHRRGRVRDDRHPGAAPPVPGDPVRLLDRRRLRSWACSRRASSPVS